MTSKSKTITIEIQDGLLNIFNIPEGITIVVRDYDTDGADPETLNQDSDGIDCFEAVHTSEDGK
jgi:hypothetical protein